MHVTSSSSSSGLSAVLTPGFVPCFTRFLTRSFRVLYGTSNCFAAPRIVAFFSRTASIAACMSASRHCNLQKNTGRMLSIFGNNLNQKMQLYHARALATYGWHARCGIHSNFKRHAEESRIIICGSKGATNYYYSN